MAEGGLRSEVREYRSIAASSAAFPARLRMFLSLGGFSRTSRTDPVILFRTLLAPCP